MVLFDGCQEPLQFWKILASISEGRKNRGELIKFGSHPDQPSHLLPTAVRMVFPHRGQHTIQSCSPAAQHRTSIREPSPTPPAPEPISLLMRVKPRGL